MPKEQDPKKKAMEEFKRKLEELKTLAKELENLETLANEKLRELRKLNAKEESAKKEKEKEFARAIHKYANTLHNSLHLLLPKETKDISLKEITLATETITFSIRLLVNPQ